DRADVENDATVDDLAQQARILPRADAVPEPARPERLEGAANRRRTRRLARMGHRGKPFGPRGGEGVRVRLGGELRLRAAEPDAEHPALPVLRRIPNCRLGLLELEAAGDVRRQPHLDPENLARLLS